jgi:hypothetical protein
MVTIRLEDGVEVALEAGHSPRWPASDVLTWGPQDDGRLRFALEREGWAPASTDDLLSGNSIAAAAGRVAVHRTNPFRVLTNFRGQISGATDPAISDDGEWIAYLLADQPPGLSTLIVERADGEGEPRIMATGALSNPRFGGRTLVWEAGNGRVSGCADVGNPHVDPVTFRLPAWTLYKPVPAWVPNGGALLVLLNADRGQDSAIVVAEWASLELGAPQGWAIGVSTGSGYEHEIKPLDGGPLVSVDWFDPAGNVASRLIDVRSPRAVLAPPVRPEPPTPPPQPPVLPDQPFVVDPNGVIEDIAPWLFSPNQGPDVHLSPDGRIRFYCKSDEGSGDGPGAHIGEHWDLDDRYIGHLDDASTGRRILDGVEVTAEEIVARFPTTHAEVWARLPLNHNWFRDGARLWMPRRLVSGTRIRYVTDILWTAPTHETRHSRVWANIPIEIRIDVGHGVIHGREVRARVAYVPDGKPEWNFYGPPNGQNAWVAHHAGPVDPWSAR